MNKYTDISNKIIATLKAEEIDEKKIEIMLDKRQEILDKLSCEEIEKFKVAYKKERIDKIDEEIRDLLEGKILKVKEELSDYKVNKSVNFAYANANKNNFNIFSRKV